MTTTIEKIQVLQKELNTILIERESQVEAMLSALVSGTHVLLLGPPGTAKSMLADLICQSIDGANYFQWLLTKFSTPEEIFGPVSMSGLKQDQYRRITTGKLPEAHICFLDECFKANSAILNALLTAINEKKFHNNGAASNIPLISCVGASNELPQGEELGALYDRFPQRFWVNYIENDNAFCDMLSGIRGNTKPQTKLTLDEIKELQQKCESTPIKKEMLQTIREIMHELKQKGISASDRRWKMAVKILKAYAVIRGNVEVTDDELEILCDIMWDRPEDRKTIISVVAPRTNPLNLKAIQYLDEAEEVFEAWKKANEAEKEKASMQALATIKNILKGIESDVKDRPVEKTRKLSAAKDTIRGYQKQVSDSILGL